MKTITISGHYDGKAIILDEPIQLKQSQSVLITILPEENASDILGAIQLSERGIDINQAQDLRWRLKSIAADWNRPDMDLYDNR